MHNLSFISHYDKWGLYIAIAFFAFAIGRIGHIFGGQLKTPHHWIYGAISIVLGLVFYKKSWAMPLVFFGLGMLISDFKDFLTFQTFQPDLVEEKRFWGVD